MNQSLKTVLLFALVAGLILFTGFYQSWNTALVILNMGLVSAIMALGVNLQWGIAGLFNVGVMGFVALGGLAVVLTSVSPVPEAWAAGGPRALLALVVGTAVIAVSAMLWKRSRRGWLVALVLIAGFFLYRWVRDDAVNAIEAVNPAGTGFLGGLGLPVVLAWPMGGLLAAGAAWVIGKTALGLRSDYLAIATLGISEIVIAVLKNEDWLARGVKNVTGLKRPVPYEIDLQQAPWFVDLVSRFHADALANAADAAAREAMLRQMMIEASSAFVKIAYAGLFTVVLLIILALCVRALNSPWGRMMRAIRDNEEAAAAMGKDIKARHLQVFVLGSAIIGIAGAMMTTLDGQFTPGTYNPLRFTFLIWVMVIVGGSGNNLGAVIGGFLIWFIWVEAEPAGRYIVELISANMDPASPLYSHLQDVAAPFRLFVMGLVLLIVLRFSPRGLLPEKVRHS